MPKMKNRLSRKRRIRARVQGTTQKPRMTVYRSLTQMTAQIIDDTSGKTIASASTKELKAKPNAAGAKKLGALIAKKAKDAGISAVVFDRNAYAYHGRVQILADAAREGGLTF
ncbi:50S ribosomal protein L18 [Candidatus Peregrinibacteria bacterium CG10_big_fil_rev_8_21_14_0_10_55_24]|nr:MAG: 50S ribosomal protein L18 [Candidatus Peregrinibacteria bacterium CG10_big_fil_rev_8_21_14_0_10_55_24]